MASDIAEVEKRLWSSADKLRANSGLKPSEYSRPVLGLLFLRYAETRFADIEKELQPKAVLARRDRTRSRRAASYI